MGWGGGWELSLTQVAAGAGQPVGSWVPWGASPHAGWAPPGPARHLPWPLSNRQHHGSLCIPEASGLKLAGVGGGGCGCLPYSSPASPTPSPSLVPGRGGKQIVVG